MAKIYLNEGPQTPLKSMKPSAKTVKSILAEGFIEIGRAHV